MRIRDVRTHYLRAEIEKPFGWSIFTTSARQALIVEVETDDGLIGWGEAGSGTLPRSGKVFIDEVLRPLALGEDPFNVNRIWQKAQSTFDRAGWGGGLSMQALSGLEIALWDLVGKAANLPICQLLGGPIRERIQAYATGLYYYPAAADSSAAREEEACQYVERGFRAMKMKVGGLSLSGDIDEVQRIRRAIGDNVALMVDANGAYDSRTAIQLGRELDHLDIAWFEEPVQRDDISGYLEVKHALDMPIAGGEHLSGIGNFRDLISRRAIDIVQPDLANCGGLSEAKRIAALAGAFNVRLFPHVWGTPLSMAIALHFTATLPSMPLTVMPTPLVQEPCIEFDSTPHPIRDAMLSTALRPHDGWLTVPDGPGLGMEVDPSVIRHFTVN